MRRNEVYTACIQMALYWLTSSTAFIQGIHNKTAGIFAQIMNLRKREEIPSKEECLISENQKTQIVHK